MSETGNTPPAPQTHIPMGALAWGWAGVIPFVALTAAIILASLSWKLIATTILVPYGAIILTFMGGVHWGVVMNRSQTGALLYSSGIMPSLFAVGSILVPSLFAIPLLIAGFIVLLIYDLWLVRTAILPKWYGQLRIQLTAAVVACLLIVALFGI